MIELRESQIWCAASCVEKIKQYGIVYLAAEVRTGKTITALQVMDDLDKTDVLFVTQKKAMSSIQKDYAMGEFDFKLTVVNFEGLHLVRKTGYDAIIIDESHSIGSFPKPSLRAKRLKEFVLETDLMLMSGTPNPETITQLYHQFWISKKSPWRLMQNFYKWANNGYVNKYTKMINGFNINCYDRGNDKVIMADVDKYMVKLSQEEAGFHSPVTEKIITVHMQENVYQYVELLKRDKIVFINGNTVTGDTPAKMLMKIRQLYSGTVKLDDGSTIQIDETKINTIKQNFAGKKIGIYYCFIAEGELLRKHFPNWTDDPMIFNARDDKIFICQMRSGREGVNLSTADCLVMYNIDYSATTYFQVRARLQDKNRKTEALVYWLFVDAGIEDKIYKAVSKKRNYTTRYFIRDFNLNF